MSLECRVGVVGGRRVGKSSLIVAFQGGAKGVHTFQGEAKGVHTFQGEAKGGRTVRSVGGRMVAFRVSELESIDEADVNVDVLLLCFSIGAPLSALPRPHSRPKQPLVLVGCKGDLRRKPRHNK